MIHLRGMTWKHDRGLAPMVATAQRFHETHPEVTIEWEARSLSEFGEAPAEHLAERYDMVVLDHPYMGDLTQAGCFLALEDLVAPELLTELAQESVGPSFASYRMEGHLWALPIDAAAQVSGYRADLLERAGVALPQTWDDVFAIALVRRGFVSLALFPLDSLMCFFTLCANAGNPAFTRDDCIVERATGEYALKMLRRLCDCSAANALEENPIAVWERMSSTDETAYCPLAFGYSNYARSGYRPRPLSFGLIPSAGYGAAGATLGGAGLAVSARCAHQETALAYAAFVAGRACQRTLYVESGGQPGNRRAWLDGNANSLTRGYFRATLPVLDKAFLRPRHAGFGHFQNIAADLVHGFLRAERSSSSALDALDSLVRSGSTAAR